MTVHHTKFHRNPSSGSHYDTCGRTDGRRDQRDECNGLFSL